MSHTILKTLFDAVAVSPDNGPLRFYLAETLREHQCWAEAANEYLAALRLEEVSIEKARFGLAYTLLYLNRPVAGIELIESLLDLELTIPLPPIHLLHARLLLLNGDKSRAVGEYIRAVEGDRTLVDPELAVALGLQSSIFDQNSAEHQVNTTDAESEVADTKATSTGNTNTETTDTENDATNEYDIVDTEADAESSIIEAEQWNEPIVESEINELVDVLSRWLTEDDLWER